MSKAPIRLALSVVLSAALAWLVFTALPDDLDVRTDIVGYPTYANFNIDRYFWAYGLTVVVFPLAALAIYLLLTRIVAGSFGRWGLIPRPLERVEAIPAAAGRREWLVGGGRTIFVGSVLGYEAAIIWGPSFELAVSTTLAYAASVGLAAWPAARLGGWEPLDVMSSANTVVAPLTVGALYGVSRSTEVTVSATGAVHAYPWLPAWLAVGAASVLLVWLGIGLRRATSRAAKSALERRALLLVVAPVGLFVFVASLPGALGTFDFYEEGQLLAATELTRNGAFPWRDLLVAHGFLHDVVYGLIGTEVFEDSRWGATAGRTLFIEPLSWVGLYYLCTYLFGANWLFLVGTQLLVITGHVHSLQIRFALLPFVLLLLAALLQRPTVGRAASFTSLLAVQVLVTPEALAAAVAYVATLVLFELYYYERGRGLVAGFRRVWLCLATAAVLAVGWSAFLVANGALDDWVFSFTTFIPGHRLTGGIPLPVANTEPEVLAPVVLVLLVFAFFVARTLRRRPLALQDWLLVAMGGLTLLYYTKFLSRADHIQHSLSVAVPALFYVVYRGITFAEAALAKTARARGASWFPARHTLTMPLLFALLVSAPVALPDAARAVPGRFAPEAPREPELDRIGYDREGENDEMAIRDVSRSLESMLEPGDTVFDFSNAPGLFHYLLDLPPSTRYYHVSLAIRQRTQSDLLRLLEKEPPSVVVFTSDGAGRSLPSWDGLANQVRHYDVSEYLLDRYVPVLDSHGFVLMRRREVARADQDLYFHVPACDWGYVPNFFSPEPAPSAKALALPFRRRGSSPALSWTVTLPEDGSAAEYGWLELGTGEKLRAGTFRLADPLEEAPDTGGVIFTTLDGGAKVRVRIGVCSQWRGYGRGVLRLTSTVPQDLRSVRLLR